MNRILWALAAAVLLAGCVTEVLTPQTKFGEVNAKKKDFPPLEGYQLEFVSVGPLNFKAGEEVKLSFALRNKGLKPDLVAKTIVPDVVLPAHVAVLDARFYTGKQFPQKYQGGAFIAFHGSWNRAQRIGYSVVHIPFKNGKPAGPPEDFLTGFMTDPNSKEVWGRPVGLLQMTDGSLLVSDDGGNKLWHITYKK